MYKHFIRHRALTPWWSVLVIAVIACESGSCSNATGSSTSSAGSGGSDDAGLDNLGTVTASYSPLDGGYNLVSAFAANFGLTATVPKKSCHSPPPLDGCNVMICPANSADAGAPTFVSAGTITVSGGEPFFGGTGPLVVMPVHPDDTYISSELETLPDGGAGPGGLTLTISAMGDTVPAFSAEVTLPHDDLTVTSPPALVNPPPGSPTSPTMTLVRSSGLPILWTGGTSGVTVVITQLYTSGATVGIDCSAPGSAGQFNVTSAVLGNLATSDTPGLFLTTVSVTITENTVPVSVPGWTIIVTGQAGGGPSVYATVQ